MQSILKKLFCMSTNDSCISNNKGFTLIEVISVMVIMGVLGSVGVKKFDLLSHAAADRVLLGGIRELNTREILCWTKIKLDDSGWTNDVNVFSELDTNLGQDLEWTVAPSVTGGTLRFESKSRPLTRTASSNLTVGRWN